MSLYQQLQRQLAGCRSKDLCCEKAIECCFAVANYWWNKVKEKVNSYEFKGDEEEIEFFRRLKPKFTAQIEYYGLLYHAAMFEPPGIDAGLIFWRGEYSRLQKFEAENTSFLACYKKYRHQRTAYYFLRKHFTGSYSGPSLYDVGTKAITNGDGPAATYLALKNYQPYVRQKLLQLGAHGFTNKLV